jgi:hypothetical protein
LIASGFVDLADESAAPQPGSALGGEHELVVVSLKMLAQQADQGPNSEPAIAPHATAAIIRPLS